MGAIIIVKLAFYCWEQKKVWNVHARERETQIVSETQESFWSFAKPFEFYQVEVVMAMYSVFVKKCMQ